MLHCVESRWIWSGFLIILTTLFYTMSPRFRYHFKFAIFGIAVSVVSLIIIPVAMFRPRDVRNSVMSTPLMNWISKLLGIVWELRGEENLAGDFACVVVCNHQSFLDFLGLMTFWPTLKKCSAVAKRELLHLGPFGLYAWLCGYVFIDRSDSKECRIALRKAAENSRLNKIKLLIFPEATRTKEKTLKQFKKGAFFIAIQNKLPIVPVVFSPYSFVNDETKIFNSGKMIVNILPPIEMDRFGVEDVGKLAGMVQDLMSAEFHRLGQLVSK